LADSKGHIFIFGGLKTPTKALGSMTIEVGYLHPGPPPFEGEGGLGSCPATVDTGIKARKEER